MTWSFFYFFFVQRSGLNPDCSFPLQQAGYPPAHQAVVATVADGPAAAAVHYFCWWVPWEKTPLGLLSKPTEKHLSNVFQTHMITRFQRLPLQVVKPSEKRLRKPPAAVWARRTMCSFDLRKLAPRRSHQARGRRLLTNVLARLIRHSLQAERGEHLLNLPKLAPRRSHQARGRRLLTNVLARLIRHSLQAERGEHLLNLPKLAPRRSHQARGRRLLTNVLARLINRSSRAQGHRRYYNGV
ncbi:uncharacterized protein PGTG_01717 [Puccinia graminis f. sp. tritici CRL 75-36-700-3]|uniref:Uncharacterized protein n=1 Tax=Puccinia graminis f. sp. tritici (strain CRL 75-36-700-3 / race SCCL) TaxID=418459 RepID=E3JSU9_PUCGT|nr:uncharacterized protein PGTG_01717 [Puccinia graminis f. sp. tritici CRL 75-36-700-3]EFP75124.2 hypothetical protein PGTG_01717 [Puccinia graminis f. sp. tritici CRL 75-36-700-3]